MCGQLISAKWRMIACIYNKYVCVTYGSRCDCIWYFRVIYIHHVLSFALRHYTEPPLGVTATLCVLYIEMIQLLWGRKLIISFILFIFHEYLYLIFLQWQKGINKIYNIANLSKLAASIFDTSIPQKLSFVLTFFSVPSSVLVNMQARMDCVTPLLFS